MTAASISVPHLVTSRRQAQEMLAGIPDDLHDCEVILDCSGVQASPPSFVDEVVKIVLVDRKALRLRLRSVPERAATYAEQAAQRRGVVDRLEVELRQEPIAL